MFLKAVILFLAIATVYGSVVPNPVEIEAEGKLVQTLIKTLTRQSSGLFNIECVEYYSPILKGYVDTYYKDIQACQDQYDNAHSEIDESFRLPRDELAVSVRDTCLSLLACDGETLNLSAFNCLAENGPSASKIITQDSYSASDNKAALVRELSVILETRTQCQNEAYRTYEINHDKTTDDMSACLADPNWEFPTTDYALEDPV
ncbi:uncharacterized protein LOC108115962 [Drosophila eugracilis]|uniref:uncharacterized protein LOC108115962 n=1 Tax=Drosophila eugracilis TaxID=29029 RepID=UPI0007E72AF7|nr:uncharacterized protein LOC108115962 [Drosophila eugracilis]